MNNLGLSLSGGGYRASAFHLGTLRALHKMKILDKLDVISTISGGSITGAAFALNKTDFESFEKMMVEKITTANIVRFVLLSRSFFQLLGFTLIFWIPAVYFLFTNYPWLFPLLFLLWIFLLLKFQFHIFPVSNEIEKAYNKFLFNHATLIQLPPKPTLAIGSSNLQTGRPFTFSWRKMGDSTYDAYEPPIKFQHENFPVARAVAASSCVPFAFTPIKIDRQFFINPLDYDRINPKLIDGGVYDNQGIQKITQKNSNYECRIIITSDAGGKLSFTNTYNNTFTLLIRTVDLFMNRIKAFQMVDNIYDNVNAAKKEIAYLSLGWDLDKCLIGFVNNMKKGLVLKTVMDAHDLPQEWQDHPKLYEPMILERLKSNVNFAQIEQNDLSPADLSYARNTSTNLTALPRKRAILLAQHAENLTELQVKLYCPSLL